MEDVTIKEGDYVKIISKEVDYQPHEYYFGQIGMVTNNVKSHGCDVLLFNPFGKLHPDLFFYYEELEKIPKEEAMMWKLTNA